jgi:predicted ATPase/serine/threonine protein kinase
VTSDDDIPAPDPLLGAVLDGKYRLDALLGRGGFGAVYRGYHTQLERRIAVKVIKPAVADDARTIERFKREALAIARLKHPNIVAVYDFGIASEVGAYLVMEYIGGHSLREHLRTRGPVPISAAVDLARQICSALNAAHLAGVVHRDLKPENLFLERAQDDAVTIKILDFGIAKLRLPGDETAPEGSDVALTVEGSLLGTPLYMSPEQCQGLPADERSDVYALACVLYEMIAGKPPFRADTVFAVLRKHVERAPRRPSEAVPAVPQALDDALLRALAKDPGERFQSPVDFARALVQVPRVADDGSFPRVLVYKTGDLTASAFAPAVATHDRDAGGGHSTQRSIPNNLPRDVTSFVGRETDVADVAALLGGSRLATLTGPGGIGKTRLALRVAVEILPAYSDGAWLVELASVSDSSLVARAAAEALAVREDHGVPTLDTVVRALEGKRALILLDNCEHVLAGCAELVGSLRRLCPWVRVLATSRQALGVPGEAVWPVPALRVPQSDGPVFPGELLQFEAVRLFVERARQSRPEFDLSPSNATRVVTICRHLDGLPLAIELAAARTKLLSVEQIATRLSDRFRLLTQGPGTTPRQQTLRSAIDWSYDFLSDPERTLFDRLSVFVGGFTIEAAETICPLSSVPGPLFPDETAGADDKGHGTKDKELETEDVLDLLSNLVDKSLVSVVHGSATTRYRLLETLREYAAEKLDAAGESETLRRRHRDYFFEFATEARAKLEDREGKVWGDRLQADLDNIRAALEWSRAESRDTNDGVPFLALATAMWVFWYQRGYLSEGRTWLEGALEQCGDAAPVDLRAAALTGAGNLANDQSDIRAARAFHERSLVLHRERGDARGIASSLNNLGIIDILTGDFRSAGALFDESYAICREICDERRCALSLLNQATVSMELGEWDLAETRMAESLLLFRRLEYDFGVSHALVFHGLVALHRNDLDRLERFAEEGLDLARRIDGRHNIAYALYLKGCASRLRGEIARAEAHYADALGHFRDLGDRDCSAVVLVALARSARQRGDLAQAAAYARESLRTRSRLGAKKGIAECLEETAAIAAARGPDSDAERAAELIGAVTALRGRLGAAVMPVDRPDRDATWASVVATLGDENAFRAREAGAALGLEEAEARAEEVL